MTIESFDPEKLPHVGDPVLFEDMGEPAAREAGPQGHGETRIGAEARARQGGHAPPAAQPPYDEHPPRDEAAPQDGRARAEGRAPGAHPHARGDEGEPAEPAEALAEAAGGGSDDLGVAPVDRLTHSIIANRPLDEVLRLITLLDESPAHARVATEAVKAAALERSVDDVTELVERLSRPPHSTDAADEAIRTATEHRPVDDVSRLVTLLHRTPEDARAADEAISYAARTRSVEELAQLISRLGQDAGTVTRSVGPPTPYAPLSGIEPPEPEEAPAPASAERARRDDGAPLLLRAPAAGALLLCAVLAFPLLGSGMSGALFALFVAVALLGLGAAARLLCTARGAAAALLVGAVAAAALAAMRLVPSGARGDTLNSALRHTLAPSMAVLVVALLALLLGLGALAALMVAHGGARAAAKDGPRAPAGSTRSGTAAWEAYLRGEQSAAASASAAPAAQQAPSEQRAEHRAAPRADYPIEPPTAARGERTAAPWPAGAADPRAGRPPAADPWAGHPAGAWGEEPLPEWGPGARRTGWGEAPEGR
ncbi:hypothetical protein [Streptomyces sp. NPDC050560]|uniref:hypothetical protein n=1 Tax=Streptomyces sp. NPDC050560 TaxID=3365630 RepID=UPI0037B896C7